MFDIQTLLLIVIAIAVAPKAVLLVLQFFPLPAKLIKVVEKLTASGNGNGKILEILESNHFKHLHEEMMKMNESLTEFRREMASHNATILATLSELRNKK